MPSSHGIGSVDLIGDLVARPKEIEIKHSSRNRYGTAEGQNSLRDPENRIDGRPIAWPTLKTAWSSLSPSIAFTFGSRERCSRSGLDAGNPTRTPAVRAGEKERRHGIFPSGRADSVTNIRVQGLTLVL